MGKEDPKVPRGDDDNSSGEVDKDKEEIQEEASKFVSRDAYSKSLTAERNAKARAKAAEAEVAKFKADKVADDESKLKEQNRWQEIAEANEKKAKDAVASRDELYGDVVEANKREAVLGKLSGKLLDPAYSSFLDLDKVTYDAETGVDMKTVEEVAIDFMEKHPHLLEAKKGGKLPGGAANKSKGLTHADWLKLPTAAEKKSRLKDVID